MIDWLRSKVKVAISRHPPDRCWPISRERNVLEIPKLLARLPTPLSITRTSFKVKGQRARSPRLLMLRSEVQLPNEKAYELLTWYTVENEDLYHQQAPWRPRSKVKVAMSHGATDRCWPISRERKVPEIPKLVGRLPILRAKLRTGSESKGQRLRSAGRPKVYHIYGAGRPTNFTIGTPMEHAINCHGQLQRPMKLGGNIPCRPNPTATQLVKNYLGKFYR